jgi:hypothetical protein
VPFEPASVAIDLGAELGRERPQGAEMGLHGTHRAVERQSSGDPLGCAVGRGGCGRGGIVAAGADEQGAGGERQKEYG